MKHYTGIIKIAILIILSPAIIWELSLKKTYALYNENKQAELLVNKIDSGHNCSPEPFIANSTPMISNGKLLEILALDLKENQIEVIRYNPALINEIEGCKLYSGILTLQGKFINLVKTIDVIEKKKLPVKLSSSSFSHHSSKGKPITKVELTLIFQQIEI